MTMAKAMKFEMEMNGNNNDNGDGNFFFALVPLFGIFKNWTFTLC